MVSYFIINNSKKKSYNPLIIVAGKHQKRLLQTLFKSYDPLERPVENENESLSVEIGLALQQIVDVVSFFFILLFF